MKVMFVREATAVLQMPQQGATLASFRLSEGQEVMVHQTEGRYSKVQLGESKIGWVLSESLTDVLSAALAADKLAETNADPEKFDFSKWWAEYWSLVVLVGGCVMGIIATIMAAILDGWRGGILTFAVVVIWILWYLDCGIEQEKAPYWRFKNGVLFKIAIGVTIAVPVLVYLAPWPAIWEFLRLTAEASGVRTAKGIGILFSAYTMLPTLWAALLPTSITMYVWAVLDKKRAPGDGVKWPAFAVLVGLFLISLWWAVGIVVYIGNIWYLAATAMTAILAFFGAIRVANEAPLRWS